VLLRSISYLSSFFSGSPKQGIGENRELWKMEVREEREKGVENESGGK
jgi:hypothetical protein